MTDNHLVFTKGDIESRGGEIDYSASAHRTLQCFFGILFTLLGTAFVTLLCQPQLVDPEIVASSTIKFPIPPVTPLDTVNITSPTATSKLDPSMSTMRHEQEQINQILNSPSESNTYHTVKTPIAPVSTILPTSTSSSTPSTNVTKTVLSSRRSEHIKLVRESGQYYLIIHNVKHAIAKNEFDYFNLKLDDVENLIPNSKISKLPDGESFMKLPEPFRLEIKKKFRAENHYGFYTTKNVSPNSKEM